jgi:hypothetical protein
LKYEDKKIVNREKNISFSLEPDEIKKALENKILMPSMALTYCVLSFYYGLHCGGGFCQVNYLTEMKSAYKKMLQSIGKEENSYQYIDKVDTEFFCGEFVLATISNEKKTLPATPYDLILYGDSNTAKNISDKSKKITLREATDGLMFEFYRITTGERVEASDAKDYNPSIYEKALSVLRQ